MDDYGLPKARERASPEETVRDPYAVVDHLSAAQCAGMNGYNFYECQRIFNSCQENWAEVFGTACEEVNKALEAQ